LFILAASDVYIRACSHKLLPVTRIIPSPLLITVSGADV